MAGASPSIGHDRGGLFQDRLPVRIGFVGDEDLAGLELFEVSGLSDNADAAGRNATAYAAPGDERVSRGADMEGFHDGRIALGLHRFRPGLEDEKRSRLAVLGPFQVHRYGPASLFRVVLLDQA